MGRWRGKKKHPFLTHLWASFSSVVKSEDTSPFMVISTIIEAKASDVPFDLALFSVPLTHALSERVTMGPRFFWVIL